MGYGLSLRRRFRGLPDRKRLILNLRDVETQRYETLCLFFAIEGLP